MNMIHPLIKEELNKLEDEEVRVIAEAALLASEEGTEQEIMAAVEKKLQLLLKREEWA